MAKDTHRLTSRYAKALLEVVVEKEGADSAEKFEKELRLLSDVLKGELSVFFHNPVFTKNEKEIVLDGLLAKQKVNPMLERFLHVLLEQGHLHRLGEILEAFVEADRERKNEVWAHVRTAFALSKDEEQRISQALGKATGKKVLMESKVDSALIGGVVAEVGGIIYDASIAGYLERLEEEYSL